jgi:hypothetical protein
MSFTVDGINKTGSIIHAGTLSDKLFLESPGVVFEW